ncbi:hypothetical protein HRM2_18980 [Desulforapulum autotrophicum HRM2]|uniref:Uncharacterized protein n=1 Tax=Desulforapulum autotrophicum (strain ATCC 43914 / DSM 3382 / VKM B-1955 / HRM2) TaxID=177437 RepID=C0QBY7_DESAH|nr:hypothetical protein HRM2_18980 [Desulforapulum autotrophicum HRM2]
MEKQAAIIIMEVSMGVSVGVRWLNIEKQRGSDFRAR